MNTGRRICEMPSDTPIPLEVKGPLERASYCREQVATMLNEASAAKDEEKKFMLLSLAEQWMRLAFKYRREANDS